MVWTVDGGPGGPMTAPMNKLTRLPSCRIGELIHRVVAASRQEVRWPLYFLVGEDLLHQRNGFHPTLLIELRKHHQRVDRPIVAAGLLEQLDPDARYISRQAVVDDR